MAAHFSIGILAHFSISIYKQSTMNNPFEEIFKRLENIEKMISPVGSSSSEEPDSRQSVLVKISVASRITGYSVNYLYHLASSGAIPYVKRGRSLRFDVNELQQWMQQQYIPASNKLSDERKRNNEAGHIEGRLSKTSASKGNLIPCTTSGLIL